MTPSTLIVESIVKHYAGKQVLHSSTIRAETGRIIGLFGRNGSGKSTLLKIVFGLEKPDEGSMLLDNQCIKNRLYTHNNLISYLPQRPFLPKSFKVTTVLKHFAVEPRRILDHFPELATDMDKEVHQLSSGTERLISVLTIILSRCRFVLLDEPFSYIMPLHLSRLQALILKQKEDKGLS